MSDEKLLVLDTPNEVGFVLHTTAGDVHFRAHADSGTVERLAGLCEGGALPEFMRVYHENEPGQCHRAAFEFAYALLASLGRVGVRFSQSTLGHWKWCVGRRGVCGHDAHSWLEHEGDGEAFDISRMEEDRRACIYVRRQRRLWTQYQVEGVESRSFYDVARWMSAADDYPLFPRYPELSEALLLVKAQLVVVKA